MERRCLVHLGEGSLARLPHKYHRRTLPMAETPRSRGSYETVFKLAKMGFTDRLWTLTSHHMIWRHCPNIYFYTTALGYNKQDGVCVEDKLKK